MKNVVSAHHVFSCIRNCFSGKGLYGAAFVVIISSIELEGLL